MNQHNYAKIHLNENGTPVSEQFDDVYYSNSNGLAETKYVFIEQNNISHRVASHDGLFVIAETGFGTGLNFLSTWDSVKHVLAHNPNLSIHFISFEKYPISKSDLEVIYQTQPELSEYSNELLQHYPNEITGNIELSLLAGRLKLTVIIGDVLEKILQINNNVEVNAWYLDGFAPSKNPDMWQQTLFDNMARLSAPNATLATFTAAGFVRRGLTDAGFIMQKQKGFGHKREMLIGTLANND